MSEEALDPELTALESALGGLVPRSSVNRDRLLFRAGQASVQRPRWVWPGIAASLLFVALGLGVSLLHERGRPPVERLVYVHVPVTTIAERDDEELPAQRDLLLTVSDPLPAGDSGYLNLRRQVVLWGVDALPNPRPTTAVELPLTIERLLGKPPTPTHTDPS